MKNWISTGVKLFFIAISTYLGAEEASKEETQKSPWKSNIEFGYVSTSGNTETTSINGGFSAVYELERWRHSLDLKAIFGSAENDASQEVETNAERYFIEGKTDYKFSKTGYAFLLTNYDDDRFSGNDYQVSVSAGRGFSFKTTELSKLDLELGLGYRTTKQKETLTLPEDTVSETIFRMAAHYAWDISKSSKFEQKLSTDIGEDNTVTKSYSGLSANVADNLALKLSVTATHQSDVRGDSEELDTITAFTLVYNF